MTTMHQFMLLWKFFLNHQCRVGAKKMRRLNKEREMSLYVQQNGTRNDQRIRNSFCLDQRWHLGNHEEIYFPEAPGNLDRALTWGEKEKGARELEN